MKYRQWKKNYKKRYGVNPPAGIDKRKQRKAAARGKALIDSGELSDICGRVTEAAVKAMASFLRGMGNGFDAMGTACRDAANHMYPLEIRGKVLSWEVKPVVCDYGVYENNALDGTSELKLITNSRSAAEKIVEIMQKDQLRHFELNCPERVQNRDTVNELKEKMEKVVENCLNLWTK